MNYSRDTISFPFKVNLMPRPFIVQDPYFKKAKDMGFRARSAFKLLEIQERYPIIQDGMCVLDVGCAPGSFMQVVSKIVGETGRVI
jgi:23S rRNA (uridine2552-2'-O)-methyltransferase